MVRTNALAALVVGRSRSCVWLHLFVHKGQKQQQKGIYPCPSPVGIRRKKKIYDGRKSRPLAVSGAPAVVRRRSWWPRRAYRGEDGQEEEGGGEEGRRRQGQGEGEDQPDPLPGGPAFRVRPCPMHACLALTTDSALARQLNRKYEFQGSFKHKMVLMMLYNEACATAHLSHGGRPLENTW